MTERLLVTGASGFIGASVLDQDLTRFEVHAVSRRKPLGDDGITWHRYDLLTGDTGDLLDRVRPTHLLHLAWITTPGVYQGSEENRRWLDASFELIQAFSRAGGQRAIVAGTCMEYDLSQSPAREDQTPTRPNSLYAECKEALFKVLREAAPELGISLAWARVFYLYGPREKRGRLVSSLVSDMLQGREAVVMSGQLKRDYMYVGDVAAALVHLTGHEVTGPVNIGLGRSTELAEIGRTAARACGTEHLLRVENRTDTNAIDEIVADTTKLRATGWEPTMDLATGMQRTVDWWRTTQEDE